MSAPKLGELRVSITASVATPQPAERAQARASMVGGRRRSSAAGLMNAISEEPVAAVIDKSAPSKQPSMMYTEPASVRTGSFFEAMAAKISNPNKSVTAPSRPAESAPLAVKRIAIETYDKPALETAFLQKALRGCQAYERLPPSLRELMIDASNLAASQTLD